METSRQLVKFSHSAIKKAVLVRTAGSPLTVYPLVLGALGGLAVFLLEPSPLLSLAAAGAATVGLGSWIVNYFVRRETYARRYLEDLHRFLEARTSQALENLEEDLDSLESSQGVAQLRMLGQKFDNLTEVLKRRLNASELTYGRYLGTAEQVYLSAVDNLRDIAVGLRSVSTIDPGYINERLSELRKTENPTDEQKREGAALEQRNQLHDQQLKKVANLLAQNESAMTVLDNTATALADIRTGKGQAAMDAEAAMAELELLVKRAGKYATRA